MLVNRFEEFDAQYHEKDKAYYAALNGRLNENETGLVFARDMFLWKLMDHEFAEPKDIEQIFKDLNLNISEVQNNKKILGGMIAACNEYYELLGFDDQSAKDMTHDVCDWFVSRNDSLDQKIEKAGSVRGTLSADKKQRNVPEAR